MNVCFLKFYKTCFLFLFIASLFSCTEVITEQETVQNVTQNTYCEVSFSLNGNGDSSSRAAELKQLVKDELYYNVDVIKENGTTEKTYPESGAWTYSELYKAKLRLSAGKWKFTLKAYNDDKKSILVLISGQTSMEIKAGTNRIKFEMKEPVDGIGDFTMKMNLGSDVNEVTAKLCHLDGTDVTTEELGSIWSESDGKIEQSWLKSDFTTSDDGKTSYVEYNIKNIKKGYYMVCWKFSKENENEPQTFNSLATVVTGCANSDSYDVREDANKNPDVVSYYSVFYDLNVEDESLVKLPDGITLKDTKLYKEGDDVKIITFELVREGYDFVGWRPDSTHIYQVPENKDTPVKFKMQTANVKLTASWIPSNSTKYTVRHWKQKLNESQTAASGTDKTIVIDGESVTCNDYELSVDDTDNPTGTTAMPTSASIKIYDGFTYEKFEQKPIAADGSTVVDVFYNRTLYKVTYSANVEGIAVPKESCWCYGAKVTLALAQAVGRRAGYKFDGWNLLGTETETVYDAGSTFEIPAKNTTFATRWLANNDTPYTVRHWKQKLNESQTAASGTDKTIEIDGETVTCKDYDLVAPDTNKFGTTAMKTNVEAIKYIGFTAPSIDEIDQKTIEADGSTVVDVFCNRESYPVTYDDGVKNESIDVPNDAYWCYGATVKVSEEVPLRTGYTFLGWTDNESATVVKYSKDGEMSFEMKAAPITLYALWEKNAIPGGSIKISKNEYAEMEIFKCEVIGDNKDVLRFTVVDGYVDCKWWIGNDDVSKTGTTYDWDTSNVASGIYDITLNAKDINGTHRSQTMTVVIEK